MPSLVSKHSGFFFKVAFRCFGELLDGDEHMMHHVLSNALFHTDLLRWVGRSGYTVWDLCRKGFIVDVSTFVTGLFRLWVQSRKISNPWICRKCLRRWHPHRQRFWNPPSLRCRRFESRTFKVWRSTLKHWRNQRWGADCLLAWLAYFQIRFSTDSRRERRSTNAANWIRNIKEYCRDIMMTKKQLGMRHITTLRL